MLLIIGGGILGMMPACAAAKAGGFSEIIVTEQVLGPSGASHYSGGVHFPYGCQDRTRSLTRKGAVALAAMAGSAVSGWCRPLAMRVVAALRNHDACNTQASNNFTVSLRTKINESGTFTTNV
ncbi:FAD-binding protein [Mesorhizobium sp. M0965]|uniref:FAD-binding protein n=1 Tax=Mesorhizobium sp. M0965 TaxID=2957036 RepID=UPI00333CB83F